MERNPPLSGPAWRPRFARSQRDVLVTGVAAGLGERWGVEPIVVRAAFVALFLAGGVGAVAYLGAWALALDPDDPHAPPPREPETNQAVAFSLIVVGLLAVLRDLGVWAGDAVALPVLMAVGGVVLLYVRTTEEIRPRWVRWGGRDLLIAKPSPVRLIAGAGLVVVGMGAFLAAQEDLAAVGSVLVGVAVTAAGLGLAFGPLVWRLLTQVSDERRDRIRSEERADVAAHLHDSVLQTLALIQRNADDPRKMVTLARRQERELRSWLYGGSDASGSGRLAAALQSVMQEVEDAHDIPVEVVVVGDVAVDDRMHALVRALREAATNAARHSGATEVSVYVECDADGVSAYVRDRGSGFDPASIPSDRRGIADSIRGRIERHGGRVEIVTGPGEGCEVQLHMPGEGT